MLFKPQKVFFCPSKCLKNMRFWCKDTFKSKLRVERMRARTTPEATLSLCLVFVRLFRELEGAAAGGILLWGREGGKGGGGGRERGKPEGGIFLPFFLPPSFLHTKAGAQGFYFEKLTFQERGGNSKAHLLLKGHAKKTFLSFFLKRFVWFPFHTSKSLIRIPLCML